MPRAGARFRHLPVQAPGLLDGYAVSPGDAGSRLGHANRRSVAGYLPDALPAMLAVDEEVLPEGRTRTPKALSFVSRRSYAVLRGLRATTWASMRLVRSILFSRLRLQPGKPGIDQSIRMQRFGGGIKDGPLSDSRHRQVRPPCAVVCPWARSRESSLLVSDLRSFTVPPPSLI